MSNHLISSCPYRSGICLFGLCLLAMGIGQPARAEPAALNDAQLAAVTGRDGVVITVHLELKSRVEAGFLDNGTRTYVVVDDYGGGMDLLSIPFDARERPDGSGSYISVGMPHFIGYQQFGAGAVGVQVDPAAPVTNASSLGSLHWNGHGSMTGSFYLWAD